MIPLAVTGATPLSIEVELEDRLADAAVVEGVELALERGPVRLGRCRFVADGGAARDTVGRLVPLDDACDCRRLVEDGNYVELRNFFHNVSIVVAQREKIRPDFKEYCANLVYDLAVYKRLFDEQDAIIAAEPPGVAEAARDALIASEGRGFFAFLDAKLHELEDLVRGFTKEEHERHGFYLRRQIWPYILSSAFLKRTNLRPRGYAGDAETMCLLYENGYAGATVFEKLLHKHQMEADAAKAVRNRRAIIASGLREVAARFPATPPHGFAFMSLASGPAWELRDVYLQPEDFQRFRCTLLDQDPHALALAQELIAKVERERGGRIAATFLSESVRTMIRTRDMAQRFGRFQYIYSMGLFDYLTPPVAKAVLARVFELLVPGGTIVVGNYHARSTTRVYMDYWVDWPLYYRTEDTLRELADGLPARSVRITEDATRCQMFLHVERGP
ncbi:MAG TPA: class I SAM-dependent methyltransferase [Anaeromyxobacter sp.]|nr:class I SAM-dependent methyltransferase [Anaeromyxobacter sp.]